MGSGRSGWTAASCSASPSTSRTGLFNPLGSPDGKRIVATPGQRNAALLDASLPPAEQVRLLPAPAEGGGLRRELLVAGRQVSRRQPSSRRGAAPRSPASSSTPSPPAALRAADGHRQRSPSGSMTADTLLYLPGRQDLRVRPADESLASRADAAAELRVQFVSPWGRTTAPSTPCAPARRGTSGCSRSWRRTSDRMTARRDVYTHLVDFGKPFRENRSPSGLTAGRLRRGVQPQEGYSMSFKSMDLMIDVLPTGKFTALLQPPGSRPVYDRHGHHRQRRGR